MKDMKFLQVSTNLRISARTLMHSKLLIGFGELTSFKISVRTILICLFYISDIKLPFSSIVIGFTPFTS